MNNRLKKKPAILHGLTALPGKNGKAHAQTLAFSLESTKSVGSDIQMNNPTFFLGLGTTGSEAIREVIRHLTCEVGEIARGVNHLMIDATTCPQDVDPAHFLSLGVDGAGTRAELGRELFEEERETVREALLAHWGLLGPADPVWHIEKTMREVTSIVLVAGAGGTSGGALDPCIDLIHEVAEQRNIQECRVYLTSIGPEISLNDIGRKVTDSQRRVIPATFSQNLEKIYAEIGMSADFLHPFDHYYFRPEERVFSLQVADQSNGQHDLATTEDLVAMLGWVLFFQRCTRAGTHFDERVCDHRGTRNHSGPHS